MNAVLHLQRRTTLAKARLRVVKRYPNAVILTDGKIISVWQLCDEYAPLGIVIEGRHYRYLRRGTRVDL